MTPLKRLCDLNTRVLREDTDPHFDFLYADLAAVNLEARKVTPRVETFSEAPSRARRLVFIGDSLIPSLTGSTNWVQTRPLFIKGVELASIVFSTGFFTVTPRPGLDSRFLNYTLASLPILQQLEAQSSGVTMKGFSAEALGNQKIPFPDIKTQCAIAEYLDTETARIDALIEKKQRMIELLERRSAATLDDRLSGLFRPDVPLVPLRHVLRERDQRAVGSETVLSVYRDYGVIVKASREDNFNKTPDDLSNYKIVRRGDVVVNKMKAWQGSLGVSSHDGIVSGDYLVCETTSAAVMHDYLHHLLRSPLLIGQYGVRSTGIRPSQWRLYWDDFASVRIPVPSASEQAELAGALEREYQLTRRLLDVVDGSIGPLREHRQALIIAAVTGELAVPGVAA